MATTAPPPDESALHFFAREGQAIVRFVIPTLIVITVVTMVTFWFWAIIPATFLVGAYLALFLTNVVERHTTAGDSTDLAAREARAEAIVTEAAELDEPRADEWQNPMMSWRLLKHETVVITAGVLTVLILATALAAIFYGPMTLLAAFFLSAYIGLLTLPVWLAAIEDDIEDETQKAA